MTLKTVLDKGYGSQIAIRKSLTAADCWLLDADCWPPAIRDPRPTADGRLQLQSTKAPEPLWLPGRKAGSLSNKVGFKRYGVNNYGYSRIADRDSQIADRCWLLAPTRDPRPTAGG